MKIGFDGKRAQQNFTGLGNYSRYLISLVKNFYPLNKYLVYVTDPPGEDRTLPGVQYVFPPGNTIKWLWRSFGILKKLKKDQIDLYHGLSNELPLGIDKTGIPAVVTIHDLIFLRFPSFYNLVDRQIYRFKTRHAALRADRIIAISEQTKRDIVSYLKIPEENIEVIYQNCSDLFHKEASGELRVEIRQKYRLPDRYLLNVGTIEERKNLLLIVKALTIVPHITLVVIGKHTAYSDVVKQYITKNGLSERVIFLENVPKEDLPVIYQLSEIFIYPSRFEGFGIPLLEALHSGVPVIGATGSSLEEAGGSGSIYIDPDDEEMLAAAINKILSDAAFRAEMIESGKIHLRNFENEKLARQVMDLYENLQHARRS